MVATDEKYLTHEQAAALCSPLKPISLATLRREHDRHNGPKDGAGRRLFTYALCDRIRSTRTRAEIGLRSVA